MNKYRDILLCNEEHIKGFTNLNDNTAGDYILPSLYNKGTYPFRCGT